MSLARVWRRQLYGASSVALVVPCAMLAALLVLALGGGFSQVGVLGQIFAGPSAPSVGVATGDGGGGAFRSLPAIPGAARVAGVVARSPVSPTSAGVRAAGRRGASGRAPVSSGAANRTGGALTSGGGTAPIVTGGRGGGGGAPGPVRPSPAPVPSSLPPGPSPQPRPTPVDQVVKVVTSVTQQVPGPVGPVATQAVQSAGSAADGLLPPVGGLPPGRSLP